MELEHILVLKEIKNLDYGKMGKKLSGQKIPIWMSNNNEIFILIKYVFIYIKEFLKKFIKILTI